MWLLNDVIFLLLLIFSLLLFCLSLVPNIKPILKHLTSVRQCLNSDASSLWLHAVCRVADTSVLESFLYSLYSFRLLINVFVLQVLFVVLKLPVE